MLRERHRTLELKLAELIRIGEENDAIGGKLQKWTRQLLLAGDAGQLPDIVVDGLGTIFSVPQVAMRLWGLRDEWANLECAQPVPVDVITLANSMTHPYCGPNADFQAAIIAAHNVAAAGGTHDEAGGHGQGCGTKMGRKGGM